MEVRGGDSPFRSFEGTAELRRTVCERGDQGVGQSVCQGWVGLNRERVCVLSDVSLIDKLTY